MTPANSRRLRPATSGSPIVSTRSIRGIKAIKGARQLKATWSKWEGLPEQAKLYEHVRATKVAKDEETSKVGNSAEALEQGAKKLKATYDFAIHTHGSIGPSCAIAEFKDGKLTSWSASQATHNLRKQLAQMFAMPLENVRCIYFEGSGCYGRNGHEDAAADAALLAKATGKPVRVQWSRADEHGWDPKGPPTLIDLRAALDASGGVTAWESEFFIPQSAGGFNVPLVAATLADMPFDKHIAPGNIIRNSDIPYKFANLKTVCHRLESTPFTPSWMTSRCPLVRVTMMALAIAMASRMVLDMPSPSDGRANTSSPRRILGTSSRSPRRCTRPVSAWDWIARSSSARQGPPPVI
jgi:hypothetical protein